MIRAELNYSVIPLLISPIGCFICDEFFCHGGPYYDSSHQVLSLTSTDDPDLYLGNLQGVNVALIQNPDVNTSLI